MNDLSVHVIAVGPFGQAVARLLRELLPAVRIDYATGSTGIADLPWPDAHARVLASWRPCPQLCRDVEARLDSRPAVFVPIVLDSPHLEVGPVVVPGFGACFSCFVRRRLQHDARPDVRRALLDFYDAHPNHGPGGFLSVLADLAAARTAQILSGGRAAWEAAAGEVWHVDVLSRATGLDEVTGIHGCERCGLQRDERTRSHAELRQAIGWLWPEHTVPASARALDVVIDPPGMFAEAGS